jgi:hypothetical protein
MRTSSAGSEVAGKKTFCTSMCGSGVTRAPKRVLNLFGSDSSTSDDETIPARRPHKRSKETSLALDIPKSSTLKGLFE